MPVFPTNNDVVSLSLPAEQTRREDALLEQVVASFAGTPDARLKTVVESLTRHLHAFVREVWLTDAEWEQGIDFLMAVGHITTDRRQEFVLLSDVLGLSMQTVAMNNPAVSNATEATVFGPFFVNDAPLIPIGGDIAGDAPGQPCWVEGSVKDVAGNPVAGARIEVWEADDDGPVGRLLAATGRSPLRASHLHFMVSSPGLRKLVTHIFVRGDALLESDSVFGVMDSLIMDFEPQPIGARARDGRDLEGESWSRTRFDIVLAPAL